MPQAYSNTGTEILGQISSHAQAPVQNSTLFLTIKTAVVSDSGRQFEEQCSRRWSILHSTGSNSPMKSWCFRLKTVSQNRGHPNKDPKIPSSLLWGAPKRVSLIRGNSQIIPVNPTRKPSMSKGGEGYQSQESKARRKEGPQARPMNGYYSIIG